VIGACPQCARRAWLLTRLGVHLDFRARDLSRFFSALELPDRELIDALGGRKKRDIHASYERWKPCPAPRSAELDTICRHHHAYPAELCSRALAPRTLTVRGGIERLTGVLARKLVAIVGTRRASDYGTGTARALGRGLAASGVTVASAFAEGIPAAAHRGALDAGGATLAVMSGCVDRCSPALHVALYHHLLARGCAISEIGACSRPRSWWHPARARTLALLADLVIVVEAEDHPWELACAQIAAANRKIVAAVPGRVSSPTSEGTNALLRDGAHLIRNPQDALDLLYGFGARAAGEPAEPKAEPPPEPPPLRAPLARLLERVSRGEDTLAKLSARGGDTAKLAVALTELELCGRLGRGHGGRYVPSTPTRTWI
jgi:DNA processing protein